MYEFLIPIGGVLFGLVLRTFGVFLLEKLIAAQEGEELKWDKSFFREPAISLGVMVLSMTITVTVTEGLLSKILSMSFLTAATWAFVGQSVVRYGVKFFDAFRRKLDKS